MGSYSSFNVVSSKDVDNVVSWVAAAAALPEREKDPVLLLATVPLSSKLELGSITTSVIVVGESPFARVCRGDADADADTDADADAGLCFLRTWQSNCFGGDDDDDDDDDDGTS
jgi:hypothetical protein